ncbi:MAG: phosphate signaling complex protein PhoU [Labilithrix sp.]|nr:phosphate signaling complex protein PhoU [Labilithrix sp.]MCW5810844.1 phosphate signaling complex protein PhoU [Labilithrix sp.]
MPRLHTDRLYEGELQKIREMLLMMGAKVEEMLKLSMRAMTERNTELAENTLYIDRVINRLEIELDDHCLRVLARRQPVASDLRFITMALKVVTDLERMGDLGVNICDRVVELNAEAPLEDRRTYQQLVEMAEAAQEMLREALDAFVAGDAERATSIVERDSKIDELYKEIFRALLDHMREKPADVFLATRVQSIAKYIERIADHATNLAEMVVFMVRGKDIRHVGKLERRAGSSKPPTAQ